MAKQQTIPEQASGENIALLVIDVQRGLFNRGAPIYQSERLLKNIHHLVHQAHLADAPVVYVQHSADRQLVQGSHDWLLHPRLNPQPEDLHVDKRHGSAFEATPLGEELKTRQVGTVVVCGLVTHGCVKATSLDALRLGYRVILAADAHSNYSKDAARLIEQWNAKLQAAGAVVIPASEIEFGG